MLANYVFHLLDDDDVRLTVDFTVFFFLQKNIEATRPQMEIRRYVAFNKGTGQSWILRVGLVRCI